jgi:hypothetical protein
VKIGDDDGQGILAGGRAVHDLDAGARRGHTRPMSQSSTPSGPVTNEAAVWFERLGQKSITTAEVREFFHWQRLPTNKAAYRAIETAWERARGRFVTRPDPLGFSVIDRRTGEPATFANGRMTGVPEQDALDIAALLNRRAISGGDSFGAH